MKHAECLHPTTNASDDFSGATCCCCVGNTPCPAVTVEQMAAHRDFDIELWTQPQEVSFAPPF